MVAGPDPLVSMLATLAALQATAHASPPPPANFCSDLRQIIAATRETEPFGSLRLRREDQWLGGIASCRRITDHGPFWQCSIPIRATPDGIDGLAARTARCLPRAERTINERRPEDRYNRAYTQFRLRRIAIDMHEFGGPGTHQGWHYRYSVRERR